jgi:hypothetical protein
MTEPTPNRRTSLRSVRDRAGRWLRRARIATCLLVLPILPALLPGALATAGSARPAGAEGARFQSIGWDVLGGFVYDPVLPDDLLNPSREQLARRAEQVIPPGVRALDGHAIALRGYVIPMEIRNGRMLSFILAAKNEIGCCFGDGLAMNQWVAVDVPQELTVEADMLEPATVLGELDVGEEIADGYVMSLYRLKAQKIRKG